jgi:hypothetical protein
VQPSKPKPTKKKPSPEMQALLDTMKIETKVLGPVQQSLLQRVAGEGRSTKVLHPSEISKESWCQRAAYFHLLDPDKGKEKTSWQKEVIFDEGHLIHDKWQKYMWDADILEGNFECLLCDPEGEERIWWDQSPEGCTIGHSRQYLRYNEVPLFSKDLMIGGHADGLIPDALVELKSVGIGTLRFEHPDLLARNTHGFSLNGKMIDFIDYNHLWEDIRSPFPSHVSLEHRVSSQGS